MTDCTFVDSPTVERLDVMGDDHSIVRAARVSTAKDHEIPTDNEVRGLINYLVRNRHGSPLEAVVFTFRIHAPIVVMRELMRHRIASYNEISGRYVALEPTFYLPDASRSLVQSGKAGEYSFSPGTAQQHLEVEYSFEEVSRIAYGNYEHLLRQGVCREVARMVLPLNTMSTTIMTANLRSLFNLISLRVRSDEATFPSYPMAEIQDVASAIEKQIAERCPAAYSAFVTYGRVAP